MEISVGLFTASKEPEPEYLPPLWPVIYFFRKGPLRVVTEAYLYRPETFETVCHWIEHIERLLSDVKVIISGDIELFSYTGVHVEHFPMHLRTLSNEKLEEIIAIFSHGLCDQMTSRVSTFPYAAQDCKVFVEILQGRRGNMNNGHTLGLSFFSQQVTLFPDSNRAEHSRLSRNQSVLWDPEQRHPWISTIMSYLTFNTSDIHRARLEDVFVDHMVYADRWAQLVGDSLKQWRASASGAFAGLVLHLPFLVLNSPCPPLVITSMALLGSALGSSIFLDHIYETMEKLSATDAMNYLESIQSPVFKFQFTAFAFSLPKALLLWGYLILLADYLLLVGKYLGPGMVAGLAGLSFFVILVLCSTISAKIPASWGNFTSFFCRRNNAVMIQVV
ncbi:hypothetical protein B0H12DRAFT_1146600 [Mycena haematopus]|nr:hypothetical protein B0H12DRAFT_1146600 [Mycena haematopus]